MDIIKTFFPGLSNEPIKLNSKYPAEVCIKKLKDEVTNSFSLKKLTQQRLIIGSVTDRSVSLSFNGHTKNSFRKTLSATIRNQESGSILRGQFSVNIIAKYLYFFIFAILAAILISVMSIILYVLFLYEKWPSVDLAIRALLVLIIFIGMIRIGRTATISAKKETIVIKQFLISLLDAEET